MDTYYLIDFENVHNEGLGNINALTANDHIHIFSTENAPSIKMDIASFSKNIEIQGHMVPVKKQSLDMHLVSYLGLLLGIHGKNCNYVVISKDKDYDNIISFLKKEGYPNISRKEKIAGSQPQNNNQPAKQNNSSSAATSGFSGKEKSDLNVYIMQELREIGYSAQVANTVCSIVISHCNDERILNGVHNDLRATYNDYADVYEDVRKIIEKFKKSRNNNQPSKKELQLRSFFGQNMKKKIYTDHKEEIISIILNGKTRQQVNNDLLKIYSDGNVVKNIRDALNQFIKDLPGR